MTERSIDPYYFTPEWIALRTLVVQMNQHICAYCSSSDGFQADHVTPRSKGGADSVSNLVACCARCNKLAGGQEFNSFAQKKAWILRKLQKRKKRSQRKREHKKAQRIFVRTVTSIQPKPEPLSLCTHMTTVGGERSMHKGGRRSVCCGNRALPGSRFCAKHQHGAVTTHAG